MPNSIPPSLIQVHLDPQTFTQLNKILLKSGVTIGVMASTLLSALARSRTNHSHLCMEFESLLTKVSTEFSPKPKPDQGQAKCQAPQ